MPAFFIVLVWLIYGLYAKRILRTDPPIEVILGAKEFSPLWLLPVPLGLTVLYCIA